MRVHSPNALPTRIGKMLLQLMFMAPKDQVLLSSSQYLCVADDTDSRTRFFFRLLLPSHGSFGTPRVCCGHLRK